jgi:hypothetical protein
MGRKVDWLNRPGYSGHAGTGLDTNQAGATMASRYITAKNAAIVGASVFPATAVARGGSMVTGSKAYKVYGAIKRPILTLGVHKKISGATTAMSLSKAYSKTLIAASVFNFGRNLQLARAKEYKRLGINVFGPPLSLFLYDYHMAHDMDAEAEIATAKQEQSGVGGSLPSKPKTPGKLKPSSKKFLSGTTPYAYKPKSDERCRKGYKSVIKSGRRMCVKID